MNGQHLHVLYSLANAHFEGQLLKKHLQFKKNATGIWYYGTAQKLNLTKEACTKVRLIWWENLRTWTLLHLISALSSLLCHHRHPFLSGIFCVGISPSSYRSTETYYIHNSQIFHRTLYSFTFNWVDVIINYKGTQSCLFHTAHFPYLRGFCWYCCFSLTLCELSACC